MDEFIVIKVMNKATLKVLKNQNKDYSKNEKICSLLEDESFFYKVTKEASLAVLNQVGVNTEMLDITYKKLVNKINFDKLVNQGKIDINDENLVVKF